MKLIEPTSKFEMEFRTMANDFASIGEQKFVDELSAFVNFEDYVDQKNNDKAGRNLKDGYVPFSTFWLVNDNRQIVGVSSLRHYLNDFLQNRGGHIGYHIAPSFRHKGFGTEILGLTLEKAKDLGLSRVMLSCDKENIGSNKIILKNGGVLEDERFDPETQKFFNRYWIYLDKNERG